MAALRLVRGRLSDRARTMSRTGHPEAAQALWAIVEEIDDLIISMARRRR